jgi:hypothetical protein
VFFRGLANFIKKKNPPQKTVHPPPPPPPSVAFIAAASYSVHFSLKSLDKVAKILIIVGVVFTVDWSLLRF